MGRQQVQVTSKRVCGVCVGPIGSTGPRCFFTDFAMTQSQQENDDVYIENLALLSFDAWRSWKQQGPQGLGFWIFDMWIFVLGLLQAGTHTCDCIRRVSHEEFLCFKVLLDCVAFCTMERLTKSQSIFPHAAICTISYNFYSTVSNILCSVCSAFWMEEVSGPWQYILQLRPPTAQKLSRSHPRR